MSNLSPDLALEKATAAAKAAQGICEARFQAFGCAGQASRIQVLPLAAMAQRYDGQRAALKRAA